MCLCYEIRKIEECIRRSRALKSFEAKTEFNRREKMKRQCFHTQTPQRLLTEDHLQLTLLCLTNRTKEIVTLGYKQSSMRHCEFPSYGYR